jgi:hypothetical protein
MDCVPRGRLSWLKAANTSRFSLRRYANLYDSTSLGVWRGTADGLSLNTAFILNDKSMILLWDIVSMLRERLDHGVSIIKFTWITIVRYRFNVEGTFRSWCFRYQIYLDYSARNKLTDYPFLRRNVNRTVIRKRLFCTLKTLLLNSI